MIKKRVRSIGSRMEIKDCLFCKSSFTAPIWRKSKTCSYKCSNNLPKSRMKGKKVSDETKKKMSDIKKGIIPKNILRGDFNGEKNNFWKGGITPLHKKIRGSKEYKDWRTEVFKRDNYTCIECKSHGITLQAHHIKPFAYYPELRLVINNGQTLCIDCHKKTDTYMHKAKNYKLITIMK